MIGAKERSKVCTQSFVVIASTGNGLNQHKKISVGVIIAFMKEKCFHLGNVDTVNLAVKKKANFTRNTFMQRLLKETCKNLREASQIWTFIGIFRKRKERQYE